MKNGKLKIVTEGEFWIDPKQMEYLKGMTKADILKAINNIKNSNETK